MDTTNTPTEAPAVERLRLACPDYQMGMGVCFVPASAFGPEGSALQYHADFPKNGRASYRDKGVFTVDGTEGLIGESGKSYTAAISAYLNSIGEDGWSAYSIESINNRNGGRYLPYCFGEYRVCITGKGVYLFHAMPKESAK